MPASWASVLLAAAAIWVWAGFEVVGVIFATFAVAVEVGTSVAAALSGPRDVR